MPLKQTYRKSPEYTVNFNYVDFAEGTGIVEFYGMTTTNVSDQKVYKLDSAVNFSNDIMTVGTAITEAGTSLDIDFDLTPFNFPKTVKGMVTVQIPWKITRTGDRQNLTTLTARLRKWDGTTETELGSESTYSAEGIADYRTGLKILKFNVAKTHFKKGEILRLSIEVTAVAAWTGSTGAWTAHLAHSPKELDDGEFTVSTNIASTQFKVSIPFDLNI